MMSASTIIFYLLAAMTLISALLAVTARKIFRAAIYLLFSLIGIAGIYFWMEYEFVAAVQIVVYVGGITVLIIFSIFLTQQPGERLPVQKVTKLLFSAFAALCGFVLVWFLLTKHIFPISIENTSSPTLTSIGANMLSVGQNGYALPFEVISLLLLAVMIGCIVIATRAQKD